MTTKTLWDRFVGLKWYWKLLLAVPVVLGIAILFLWRSYTRTIPDEIVEHGKAVTDRQIDDYYNIAAHQRSERAQAKQRLNALKKHVKERYDAHGKDIRAIDDAGSVSDVFQVVNRIRKRDRSEPPVS